MADPQKMELGNWIVELLTGVAVAVIAWALAILNRGRHQMEVRVDQLETQTGEHETRLAVVQNCQANTERRLTEIKDTASETNAKIDKLLDKLTTVLVELKTKP